MVKGVLAEASSWDREGGIGVGRGSSEKEGTIFVWERGETEERREAAERISVSDGKHAFSFTNDEFRLHGQVLGIIRER
jgi:hypothetical protein